MKIEKDMVASVHYKGTLTENGDEFDSSHGRDPLTFLVGHGQMIPGFEEEILGAEKGGGIYIPQILSRKSIHFL